MPNQPVTNARRATADLQPLLTRLQRLMAEQKQRAFEIGDLEGAGRRGRNEWARK